MKATATGFPNQLAEDRSSDRNPFRVLRHRESRLFWIGLVISATGTWMQIVALSLFVLKITHASAFALGSVLFTPALSFFFFALIGGNVADRLDKRRVLLLTQSASAGLAVRLGILTSAGLIQLWMILVISFLNGTLLSQPSRNWRPSRRLGTIGPRLRRLWCQRRTRRGACQ
jgi:predicted MFS family arabinose efflux permease